MSVKKIAGWIHIPESKFIRGLLGMLLATQVWAQPPLSFHEPLSGAKVESYSVELPITRDERRTFVVPEECREILVHAATNAAQWGSLRERSLWIKVEGDCRFAGMIEMHPREAVQDYVSGYDFYQADLRYLPVGSKCVGERMESRYCMSMGMQSADLEFILPMAAPGTEGLFPEECRLSDGAFRGWVLLDPKNGMRCREDPRAPGFRIVSVDYGDLNEDGHMDALLRLVPLGPRAGRMPMVLPLTRLEADGAFLKVENVGWP